MMKFNAHSLYSFSILVIFIFFAAYESQAQCSQKLCSYGIFNYKYSTGNEKLIKCFRGKLKRTQQGTPPPVHKFAKLLHKGNHYRLIVIDPPGFEGRAKIELYDQYKHIASSYNPETQTDYKSIDLICNRTQMYYIFISFKEGRKEKKGCAYGLLLLVE